MDKFKPLEIDDRKVVTPFFRKDPPVISEMTFTNLFMWHNRFHPLWCIAEDCLLVILRPEEGPFGLPPTGPGDKARALTFLFDRLEALSGEARVCRVPEDLVQNLVTKGDYEIHPDRDNSDYVYLTQELINLSGRKYHRKKNNLNKFFRDFDFEYRPLDMELVECFLDMQESWCEIKRCDENPNLLMEDYAIRQALTHIEELKFQGGAIVIENKIEAFTLGERLNQISAVIHIEKANPNIRGLYTAINHLFCLKTWSHVKYINREQDMGIEGLRKAKKSYHPHHMVNKFTIKPK